MSKSARGLERGNVSIRTVLAVLLLVVGAVWIGQGIGIIKGSFMTGEGVWAVIGSINVLFAFALLRGASRERESSTDDDDKRSL